MNTSTRSNRPSPTVTPFTPRRGGIAMMLVIVAVAVGTILAAAALSSNTNAPAMAANARNSVQSYWQAHAAANYTEKLIEKVASVDGAAAPTIPAQINTAGGTVAVTVTDVEGNAPDNADRELLITVVSSVGGIEHTIRRRISVAPPGTLAEAIDPELSEFAIFAKDSINIEASAMVGPWRASPEARSQEPVKIGAGFSGIAGVNIDSDADIKCVAFYPGPSATSQLDDLTNDDVFTDGGWKVPVTIPAVQAAVPAEFASLPIVRATNLSMTTIFSSSVLAPGGYRSLSATLGSIATLGTGGSHRYRFDNVDLASSSTLLIRGNVEILVNGTLSVTNYASVALFDGSSTLTIYVRGDVLVDNATIGCIPPISMNPMRHWKMVPYADPRRIKILPVTGSISEFVFSGKAIVVAAIHAPNSPTTLDGQSTLIGRATCKDITIGAGSALLYDPAMDSRLGFTSPGSPCYEAGGAPVDGLTDAIASFNPSAGFQNLETHLTSVVDAREPTPFGGTPPSQAKSSRRVKGVQVPVSAARAEKRNAPDAEDLVDADDDGDMDDDD